MKKKVVLAFSALFLLAACNQEAKASSDNKAAEAKAPVAQVAQPVAKTEPAAQPAVAKIENVDWTKAIEMGKSGAMFVDVRSSAEVADGMIEGALNIPHNEVAYRLAELPKDRDLLIYCRSGKRSMMASEVLVKNGYTRVFNVVGGFLAYPGN